MAQEPTQGWRLQIQQRIRKNTKNAQYLKIQSRIRICFQGNQKLSTKKCSQKFPNLSTHEYLSFAQFTCSSYSSPKNTHYLLLTVFPLMLFPFMKTVFTEVLLISPWRISSVIYLILCYISYILLYIVYILYNIVLSWMVETVRDSVLPVSGC